MPITLTVIDDFLSDPHAARAGALRMAYTVNGHFPGRNSAGPLRIGGIEEEMSRILGEGPLAPTPGAKHGYCRLALAGDRGSGGVHIDTGYWSGVLCLSLPEHCQGGTDFFRHKATGTDRAPIYPEEQARLGLSSMHEVDEKILQPDTLDPSKWELLTHVPMRFNRLILFRPWLWHNAGAGFGDSVHNGRLIHLIFLTPAALVRQAQGVKGNWAA